MTGRSIRLGLIPLSGTSDQPQTLTEQPYHSIALHVARRANRFVILHHVRLPSKDAIAVEAAEVLQMPVVALGLSVLIAEDQLRTRAHVRTEVKVGCSHLGKEKGLTSSQPAHRGFSLSP